MGSPLLIGPAMDKILSKRCTELERVLSRLELLAAQDALLILRTAFGSPKMLNILRSSPCAEHPLLVEFDSLLRSGISAITNCDLSDMAWMQASLPIQEGGLGVRSVVMLAPSAFLSSAAATLVLQSAILGGDWPHADASVGHIRDVWCHTYSATPPSGELVSKQKHWDTPAVSECRAILVSSVQTPLDRARLLAVASPHAGDWLKALPIASCGLRLDDKAVRVSVGLRLGLPICKPHTCVCGTMVDERGLHGLSCMRGIGRLSRHNHINDIMCRAFASAGMPTVKEPTGLIPGTELRPDGLTLIPWSSGKCLTWDVTVIDTLAPSNLNHTIHVAGSAAEAAAEFKNRKYSALSSSHQFVPFALETLGPICRAASDLITELSRRTSERSGESREGDFLFQRLSIAVQRGNAAALHCTFGEFAI